MWISFETEILKIARVRMLKVLTIRHCYFVGKKFVEVAIHLTVTIKETIN